MYFLFSYKQHSPELLEYNKLEANYQYLRQLDSGKRNNSESLYELEKILEELYKF